MPTPFKSFGPFTIPDAGAIQDQVVVTPLQDGRFVLAWIDYTQSGTDKSAGAIRAQIFLPDGTPSGASFQVNTTVQGHQAEPAVTSLADGGFVVSWTDHSTITPDGSESDIRAQVFAFDGSPLGPEILVNTSVPHSQYDAALTALADGRFLCTWIGFDDPIGGVVTTGIRAQFFAANGAKEGDEIHVNSTLAGEQKEPAAVELGDGRVLITWTEGTADRTVRGQILGADGGFLGPEFLVPAQIAGEQYGPAVAALAGGRYVIAWSDSSGRAPDTDLTAVRAQIYEADGRAVGSDFVVNQTTFRSQQRPDVVALADGRFVVAWTDSSLSDLQGNGTAIRARVFDSDGLAIGREFRVDSDPGVNNLYPKIAALADGRFVVAWTPWAHQTDPTAAGQIFDARSAAVRLNGTLDGDHFVGTFFGDALGGWFGDDSLAGMAGDDVLTGGLGNDSLSGGQGADQLDGGEGDDLLTGGGGSDGLTGGAGNDTLNGGIGADGLVGGTGDDLYVLDNARDRVIEAAGEGIDTVRSGNLSLDLTRLTAVERATLTGLAALDAMGNALANVLTGNSGGNRLLGLAGADTLIGGDGDDMVWGGAGVDLMTGGAGVDTFVFEMAADIGLAARHDRIEDFTTGEDRLDLSAVAAGQVFIGRAGFSGTAGEIRLDATRGLLLGDLNGDRRADYLLELMNHPILTGSDLILA